jgi:hypothetical protein
MLLRTLLAAVAAGFLVMTTGAALAGGSWLEPSSVRVESGDEITLNATVYRGALGWVDDGPFFAYLRGETFGVITTEGYGGAATDVLIGDLEIADGSQSLEVSVDVVIPSDTPPGEYTVSICNDPCTTGLGDLIGGVLYVGVDPPTDSVGAVGVVLETRTTPAPDSAHNYLPLPPTSSRSTDMSPLWVGFSAALGSAVLVVALITYRR